MAPSSGSGQEAQVDGLRRDEQGSGFRLHLWCTIRKLDLIVLHKLQDDTNCSLSYQDYLSTQLHILYVRVRYYSLSHGTRCSCSILKYKVLSLISTFGKTNTAFKRLCGSHRCTSSMTFGAPCLAGPLLRAPLFPGSSGFEMLTMGLPQSVVNTLLRAQALSTRAAYSYSWGVFLS